MRGNHYIHVDGGLNSRLWLTWVTIAFIEVPRQPLSWQSTNEEGGLKGRWGSGLESRAGDGAGLYVNQQGRARGKTL